MVLINSAKKIIKKTPAIYLYHWLKNATGGNSQSDEAAILGELVKQTGAPNTFIEFGFHPSEFNCIGMRKTGRGLVIDGDPGHVRIGRVVLPRNIEVISKFLTLDNLDFIRNKFPELGILSIDVDGNDYWFLKALIDIKPAIISVEYNSTFGLMPITVPYSPTFDRHEMHPSGWYHGASLTALAGLCKRYGYGLAAVSSGGMNAFFTRSGDLDPITAWRPNSLRELWSKKTRDEQWDIIKNLPFVEV